MSKTISPIFSTQDDDVYNIIRYLKAKNDKNSYQKYISPIVKAKGQKYAANLLASTVYVFIQHNINIDKLHFNENGEIMIER